MSASLCRQRKSSSLYDLVLFCSSIQTITQHACVCPLCSSIKTLDSLLARLQFARLLRLHGLLRSMAILPLHVLFSLGVQKENNDVFVLLCRKHYLGKWMFMSSVRYLKHKLLFSTSSLQLRSPKADVVFCCSCASSKPMVAQSNVCGFLCYVKAQSKQSMSGRLLCSALKNEKDPLRSAGSLLCKKENTLKTRCLVLLCSVLEFRCSIRDLCQLCLSLSRCALHSFALCCSAIKAFVHDKYVSETCLCSNEDTSKHSHVWFCSEHFCI